MPRIRLRHRTRYDYAPSVSLDPQVIRLTPAGHARAAVIDYDLPQRRLMWRTTVKGEVPR